MPFKAIVVFKGPGNAAIRDVAKPKLRDGYVLVKVHAVGLNPADWKNLEMGHAEAGARVGCDYAGVVEEVGDNLGKPFKEGDRIAGMAHGVNKVQHDDGAFGEYAIAKADIALRIPDNISFEEAATLGVSITTVGQGLYRSLKLALPTQPLPLPDKEPILIYGGSTATGIFGIQFAKLSGYSVVTTASPQHHDYARQLGAESVFDYRSPSCAQDIKAWAESSKKIRKAWDCVSLESSAEICARALADDEEGGWYGDLIQVEKDKLLAINKSVKGPLWTLAYDAFGELYTLGEDTKEPIPGELEHAREFWDLTRTLLEEGKLKTVRPTVNRGGKGLNGVLKGLEELKQGRVSGEKLVYTQL